MRTTFWVVRISSRRPVLVIVASGIVQRFADRANCEGIGADAVSDRAGVPAAEPEREASDAVGYPGLDDNRGLDLAAIRSEA